MSTEDNNDIEDTTADAVEETPVAEEAVTEDPVPEADQGTSDEKAESNTGVGSESTKESGAKLAASDVAQKLSFLERLNSDSSVDFLKGKLPWRIILAVFVTILVVQGGILYFTSQNRTHEVIEGIVEQGKSALLPFIETSKNGSTQQGRSNLELYTYLSPETAASLLRTTVIEGVAFYESAQNATSEVYGEPPVLSPSFKVRDEYRGQDNVTLFLTEKDRYEILLNPDDVGIGYHVALRLNTEEVSTKVNSYIGQTALVFVLLTAFVTTVLMLVLGKWLLEPILVLRDNLKKATKDPKHPEKYQTRYKRDDELGSVISSANALIQQNADNLTRLSKRAQDSMYRLAYFDTLTGLPNRLLFVHKLQSLIKKIRDQKRNINLYVVAMDLDNFGDVNDTLGYDAGDLALKMIAARLKKFLPPKTIISRLGEDQFAAIIISNNQMYEKVLQGLIEAYKKPFIIQENEYLLEMSAGVSKYPDHSDRATDLLKKAETALEQTKSEEKGTYRLYTQEYEDVVQSRIQIVRDLRVAITEGQFKLAYQPQFDSQTQNVVGAEALIRWERPKSDGSGVDFMRPDQFIPLAEQSGLIVPIGKWVIEESVRFCKECRDFNLPDFQIAVNLSGVQFYRDDIIARVREALKEHSLEPQYLELEVTESVVMEDVNETIRILNGLKDIGCDLAIDDFGTGYSSLAYLKRFPVDKLKIDRSFVMDVTNDPDDAAIVRSIIQMGHSLGMKVIAEGVETQGHVDFLRVEKCDELQGYFYSKPVSAEEFKGYLRGTVINSQGS